GRRAWIGPLLEAIRAGLVPPGEIPPTRRALLLNDRDPSIRARARALLGGEAPGPRAAALAGYKPALDRPGDPARGRSVFDRQYRQIAHARGTGEIRDTRRNGRLDCLPPSDPGLTDASLILRCVVRGRGWGSKGPCVSPLLTRGGGWCKLTVFTAYRKSERR